MGSPAAAALVALSLLAGPAAAETGHGPLLPVQYRSFDQSYDDGVCRVERRLERNGAFREERRCRNIPTLAGRGAFREEFDDGACEVERELERDGDYREERRCRPRGRPLFGGF